MRVVAPAFGQDGDPFMRCFTLALLLLAAAPLYAFYERPGGYSMLEHIQTDGVSGITWDPAPTATDFYASHAGGIRRFDTTAGDFVSTALFNAPSEILPANYAFFDSLAIDPADPDDFYVSYSGSFSRIYHLRRTGPDSATVMAQHDFDASSNADGLLIYQMFFVPDLPTIPANLRGRLVCAGAEGFGMPARIYVIDLATLDATPVIDVGHSNGSGPTAVDADGNIYTAEPLAFGHDAAARILRFDAAAVSAAAGGAPAATIGDADVAVDDVWNVTGLAVRDEDGGRYVYFGTYERASVYRHNLHTGETRTFIQGYGGVTDGFLHFARGGGLYFSPPGDEFRPASGGQTTLIVPFAVSTPGSNWQAVHRALYVFQPEAVNVAVAALEIKEQPTSVQPGERFELRLEALNTSGTALLSNVAVRTEVHSGNGELLGFTTVSRRGDALVVDGLVFETTQTPQSLELRLEVVGVPAVHVVSQPIQIAAEAAALEVAAPQGRIRSGQSFGIEVRVKDAQGNLVSGGADASRNITLTLHSGSGRLYGPASTTASGGVAVFQNLLIEGEGEFTLTFHSEGLPSRNRTLSVAAVDSGNGDSSGCTGGSGGTLPALALLLAGLAGLRRRMRIGSAR
jgi:hypothetical protein